ncbi:hypothetical protein M9H77_08297 [Catharanthus roseus]|uniref:Uncharacterized protein n=1 Tax=Catharanthus roseus TaxID=4058 RepID=A0ACC0BXB1_CATRO|nr:hypothetical protein M9H77_08297 [Catharanthus roseus]
MEEVPEHVHLGPIVPDVLMRQHEHSQLSTHTLVTYRDQLDFMPSDQEVDDMASRVIQKPPSSPSQIANFAKKVQTIIRRCIVSIAPSRRHPREPVPDRGARGVKRRARRVPGGGARGGRPPAPPDIGRGHADPSRGGEMGEGSGGRGLGDLGSSYQVEPFDSLDLGMPSFSLGLTLPTQSYPPASYMPPPPGLGFSSFQSPHPPGIGSFSFQAPLAPCTGSSSFQAPPPPYMVASSSDSDEDYDEPTDVVTPPQQLGFGHRVGKKTTRFTPFDSP